MLAVLAGQNVLEEFWDEPDFLESGCTTTKQQGKCIERTDKKQGNVRWFLGYAGIPGLNGCCFFLPGFLR
jgi:hypothetical protein